MRAHGNAIAQFLQVVGNDSVPGSQSAGDNPVVADLRAKLNIDDMYLFVRVHGVDLLDALQLLHGDLRDEKRIVLHLGTGGDSAELARAEARYRDLEMRRDADGAGLLVHLAIDEIDMPGVRKDSAVGKR